MGTKEKHKTLCETIVVLTYPCLFLFYFIFISVDKLVFGDEHCCGACFDVAAFIPTELFCQLNTKKKYGDYVKTMTKESKILIESKSYSLKVNLPSNNDKFELIGYVLAFQSL